MKHVLKPVVGTKPQGAGLRHGQAQADGQHLDENSHYTKLGVGKKPKPFSCSTSKTNSHIQVAYRCLFSGGLRLPVPKGADRLPLCLPLAGVPPRVPAVTPVGARTRGKPEQAVPMLFPPTPMGYLPEINIFLLVVGYCSLLAPALL